MKNHPLFSFAMMADTHIKGPESAEILDRGFEAIQCLERRPMLVIFGGDMTESGEVGEYRVFLDTLRNLDLPYQTVVGNHDIGNSRSREKYTRFLGPTNRSFEFMGVRLFFLDTNNADQEPEKWHGRAEEPVLKWVESELDKLGGKTPILLFTHQGLAGNRDELECDVENAEVVLELFTGSNLLAGFAAHAHRFFKRRVGEVDFFVCPALSTSKGNFGGEPPSLLIVDVYKDWIQASLKLITENP